MPKNILIFSDGTGQAGGIRPDQNLSNVYKLYRATRVSVENEIDPAEQVAFYDPGLGTQSEASGLRIKLLDRVLQGLGSLAGSGITENIIDCYEALLQLYEPGDRIYLFGFSRGAYTIRSLANVLNLCGVPPSINQGGVLPAGGKALRKIAERAVRHVYEHGAGHKREDFEPEREELARRFRVEYQSEEIGVPPGSSERGNVAPEFIGVFDTVAALGSSGMRRILFIALIAAVALFGSLLFARIVGVIVGVAWPPLFVGAILSVMAWTALRLLRARRKVFEGMDSGIKARTHYANWRLRNYDRSLDPRTGYARQALAIDEMRVDFTQVGWGHSADVLAHANDPIVWLKQVWFAGNHSDIGGSYSENESRLSDIALKWMIEEATAIPFPMEIDARKLHLFPRSDGPQHCEVAATGDRLGWLNRWAGWEAAPRKIDTHALLHPSVTERFELESVRHCSSFGPYRPEALRHVEEVKHFYAL